MGKLSIKKVLLLATAQFLDEVIDWSEVLGSSHLYLKSAGYQEHSIANAVSDFFKTGYLEKKIKANGEVVYSVTSQGRTKISYSIPLARYMSKKWDGIWRLVSFDIPEEKKKERNRLRKKLKELGFGMFQESLWVTPHELGEQFAQFLEEVNLRKYCLVWEGKRIFGEKKRDLAKRIYKLDDLHGKYLDLLEKYSQIATDKKNKAQKTREWTEAYFAVLLADPGLPKELLPEDWLFEKTRRLYKNLFQAKNEK